ncbi:MAG: hypothetical protein DLM73_16025 [Chthoniobacterales bacterium]|nr:MAG: hypothetical protein DLM73_16025 [Chthoniobacterales bacterium]
MTKRIILAGVLGAIAMFISTSIAHMALPLGEAGIGEIPNDTAVLAALESSAGKTTGLYIFPGMGLGPDATHAQRSAAMKDYEAKMEKNPSGLIMYHPAGSRPFNMAKYLTIEFVTELLEALLVVTLLAQTRIATFGGRVGFVTVAGILAVIATNVSYWNWWGFPAVYTASYMFIQVVGFFCIGLVAALVFRRSPAAA